jgi:hypothetical protein
MDDLAAVLKGLDLDRLRAVCRSVLADELKHLEHPERQEHAKAERRSEEHQDQASITLAEAPAERPTYVFEGTHDTTWPVLSGTSRREKQLANRKDS